MKVVGLDTAVIVSGVSRRTWWRRLGDGQVQKLPNDAKGRAVISLNDLVDATKHPFSDEYLDLVLRADAGEAEAQNDLGQYLYELGRPEAAMYFVSAAAAAGYSDAMQWLGRAFAGGMGVEADSKLSVMWLSRAAVAGHSIANVQLQGLLRANLA